jgi:hypothetical protein
MAAKERMKLEEWRRKGLTGGVASWKAVSNPIWEKCFDAKKP